MDQTERGDDNFVETLSSVAPDPPPLPTVRGPIPSGPYPSKFVDIIQAAYHAKHIFSNFGSLSMKFVVNFNLVFRMGPSGQFYWTIL